MNSMLGTIMPWAGKTAPSGWLFCSGQLVSISQYSALYALIGNKFGGDLSHSFGVPDYCGRFLSGYTDDQDLSSKGGAASVVVGLSSFPSGASHTHTVSASFPNNQTSFASSPDVTFSVPADTGGGQTATPGPNTILGAGKVQSVPPTPAQIYGFGPPPSGAMCARSVPVAVNVESQPNWTARMTHVYPPGTGFPLPIIPPYTVVNFIICASGSMPPFQTPGSVESDEGRQ